MLNELMNEIKTDKNKKVQHEKKVNPTIPAQKAKKEEDDIEKMLAQL